MLLREVVRWLGRVSFDHAPFTCNIKTTYFVLRQYSVEGIMILPFTLEFTLVINVEIIRGFS